MSRRIIALLMATAAFLAVAGPALAVDPPTLNGVVTDQTGKLDGQTARVQAAADALKSERGIDYYVLFLPTLDGEDPSTFIERTAAANGLTTKKVAMLLVTFSDRKIALWASGTTDISNSELDTIRQTAVVPKLKAGDYVGATEVAAAGLSRADATNVTPAPQAPAPSVSVPAIDWSPILQGLLLLIGICVAIGVVAFIAKQGLAWSGKRRKEQDAIAQMKKLATDARTNLLHADDAVRAADQELAFAEAEFGAPTLAPYRETLTTAQSQLQGAYEIGAQIDDDDPESYETRQDMFRQIVSRTETIMTSLSKQKDYLDHLRKDEEAVADNVKQLVADAKVRSKALEVAQASLDKVQAHGASVYDSVSHNIDVARARFSQADKTLADAQEQIDNGVRATATLRLREAVSAIADGKANLDALNKVGKSVDDAERSLDAEVETATAEIAKAESAVKANDVAGLDRFLTAASASLKAAVAEVAKPNSDFLLAHKYATDANENADKVLDGIRDEKDRRQRAIDQAQAQVRQAKAAIDQADAYITSHRTTVGRKARTQLSEARRKYDSSQVGSLDLYQAAALAVAANSSASDAYAKAREDVNAATYAASSVGSYGSSSSSGGSYGSSSSGGSYDSGSSSSSSSGSYGSSSSSSDWGSSSSSNDSFSIGSFGGGGGGSSSGGGW